MGGTAELLADEGLQELDVEILARNSHTKMGSVFEQMNRSIGTDEHNDSGSFHNTSLGTLSNQRKELARPSRAGEHDVSGHSSQDISMLSANKATSGEKTSHPQRAKKNMKDLDEKLLSLNDIMMEASQNKNKIDAEQEQKILERARAFCQGRDGRQVPNQEPPPMAF